MKRKRSRRPEDEYTHLALRIEGLKVRSSAGINHFVHAPQYAWRDTQKQSLYEFQTQLEIFAVCFFPEERVDHAYELTIYCDDGPESEIHRKLEDVQVRDENNIRQYRTYRGDEIPVYDPPKGMGSIEKVRGEQLWRATIWAKPPYISDLLVLLGYDQQLYLSINERKLGRRRWIQSISVQTSDPSQE